MKIRVRDLLQHGFAIAFFLTSWHFLSQWYLFRGFIDCIAFWILFISGLILAGWSIITSMVRTMHWMRLLLVLFLVLLALPWGEWLRQKHISSREDWTRQFFFQTLFIYLTLLFFQVIPAIPSSLNKFTTRLLDLVTSKRYLLWIPALLFFLLTRYVSLFVYKKTLLVQDSAAHFFQALIFLRGKLSVSIPPVSDFFSCVNDMLVMKDGRWFSMYPPGYSLILALAMLFRSEWIITPLLGAMSIAIWTAYASRWHGIRVAAVFGFLCLLSPFLIVMSSTLMVHVPELLIASAALFLCRMETEDPRPWQKFALFFILAAAIPVRAFSILVFLGPILAYTCWIRWKAGDWYFPIIAGMGILLGVLVLGYYQWRTTGSPWVSGYLLEVGDLKYGFGSTLGGVHTPLKGLENTSNNVLSLSNWLTGWYSGSLFFLIAFFVMVQKVDPWDRIILFSALGIVIFYFFYYFQNLVLGPRFYYILAPIMLLMIARVIVPNDTEEMGPRFLLLSALVFVSMVTFLPKRFSHFVSAFDPYRFQAGDLKNEMTKTGNTKTLIFLEQISPEYVDWNDPFLREPVILCRDLKERNKEAIQAFPEYQPMYFRRSVRFGREKIDSTFHLHTTPANRPPGYISLFELALTLQTQERNPDRDFFEVCYDSFLTSRNAALQLEYLQNHSSQEIREEEYRKQFRLAVTHAARLLLLPKLAYEEAGEEWRKHCNMNEVRNEFDQSLKCSKDAGEVGKAISIELEKVRRRVDRNSDGRLSDDEVSTFLSERLRILRFE